MLLNKRQRWGGPAFTMVWARCHLQTISGKEEGVELEVIQPSFSGAVQILALASV